MVTWLLTSIQSTLSRPFPFPFPSPSPLQIQMGVETSSFFQHLFHGFIQQHPHSSFVVKRERGNTQALEKEYSESFFSYVQHLGFHIEKAGSQQPIDFTIHHPCLENPPLLIEMKRTSTSKIMCNDTYPKDYVFYVIFHEKKGWTWCQGKDLLQGVDHDQQQQYHDQIEIIKKTFQKNGNVLMYARPNYAIDISHLSYFMESIENQKK